MNLVVTIQVGEGQVTTTPTWVLSTLALIFGTKLIFKEHHRVYY